MSRNSQVKQRTPMNQGARDANREADVYRAAQRSDQQIVLLKEIRDLLKQIASGMPSYGTDQDINLPTTADVRGILKE